MKLLTLIFAGLLVCSAYATRGSISQDLFEDDIKDTPHAEGDNLDEPEAVLAERRRNPCMTKKCLRGEKCVLNAQKNARCVCNTDCDYYEQGSRYQVCSNLNRTYNSECSLDGDHCLCRRGKKKCSEPEANRIYLDYYGKCQEQLPCRENDAKQFAERMRSWLFIILENTNHAMSEAAKDEHHSLAVIWKFCDLDHDPQDRSVSKRELQHTVRSLRAMEGCLLSFLDGCDANDDKRISLHEWGLCLGLSEGEIIDKCKSIHDQMTESK